MLFNKLEQIALQVDGPFADHSDGLDIQQYLQQVNEAVGDALMAIEIRQRQFAEKLSARQQLQAVLSVEMEMPAAAKRMYAQDQLAFYRELLGEMLFFFTGSERGRCVSFALSVEELLFFIRLLLEEKVMDASALKPIFLFLSRHARTSGSDTLSYESLRKKYSGVGATAKERVAVLLAKLATSAADHGKQ